MTDYQSQNVPKLRELVAAKAQAAGLPTTEIRQRGSRVQLLDYLEQDIWPTFRTPAVKKSAVKNPLPAARVEVETFEELPVSGILPFHAQDSESTTETATVGDEARESMFISAANMMLQAVEVKKLIGKVVERGTTGQLFGPSGSGKTFIALDMALAVGTGGEWNGNPCEQGLVLYFNGEGFPGMHRRVKAWHKQQGEPDLSSVHISRAVITFDETGMGNVISMGRELESRTGEQVALIVIDTLARHLIGDENSTKGMSDFVREVDSLRDAFPDSSAIIIHHSGNDAEKTGRSRGSSALKAACDFEMQCLKDTLTFTKVKDGALPEPIGFDLVPVQIGTDDDGEAITSCTVQYGKRSAIGSDVALTTIEQLLLDQVNDNPGILFKDLKAAFRRKREELEPSIKDDAVKKAFTRSFNGLTEKKKVFMDGQAIMVGQRTKAGHSEDMSIQKNGTDGTSSFRDVPMSLPVSMSEKHLDIEGAVYSDVPFHKVAIKPLDRGGS